VSDHPGKSRQTHGRESRVWIWPAIRSTVEQTVRASGRPCPFGRIRERSANLFALVLLTFVESQPLPLSFATQVNNGLPREATFENLLAVGRPQRVHKRLKTVDVVAIDRSGRNSPRSGCEGDATRERLVG
jgi:hypothetical protein